MTSVPLTHLLGPVLDYEKFIRILLDPDLNITGVAWKDRIFEVINLFPALQVQDDSLRAALVAATQYRLRQMIEEIDKRQDEYDLAVGALIDEAWTGTKLQDPSQLEDAWILAYALMLLGMVSAVTQGNPNTMAVQAMARDLEFQRRYMKKAVREWELMSNPNIEVWKNRMRIYPGRARGIAFKINEDYQSHQRDLTGWVVRFESVDDENTCEPCHDAQGYYLPGRGPYPGMICEGKAHCRCRRVMMHNPEIYQSLLNHAKDFAARQDEEQLL